MSIIYHNPRCSTSRAALALMQEQGYSPKIIEYLKTPLNESELQELIGQAGLTPREAIRSKEEIYKELDLDKANDDELIQAMAKHPILLNRPFVVTDKGSRLARPLETIKEIL